MSLFKSKILKFKQLFVSRKLFLATLAVVLIVGAGLIGNDLSLHNDLDAADCSVFNGNQGACTSQTTCNWDSADCSVFNGNQSTCESHSCTYPGNSGDCSAFDESACISHGSCSSNISNCYWDGAFCTGGTGCETNSDEVACTSSTYFSGCTGTYDDGSCTGSYDLGTCSGSYDNTAPTLSTVTTNVSGTTITLAYDETLNAASIPGNDSFIVSVNGAPVSINNVSISASNVIITLVSSVGDGTTVVLDYNPSIASIQDVAGNSAAALSGRSVTNNTDTIAPVLSTAIVINNTLTLTYDGALYTGSVPSEGDFVVSVNSSPVYVSSVNVTGSTVVLTLSSGVGVGTTVTLNYTPGTNPIKDVAGNNSASLSGRSVNNNSDITAPTLVSATVNSTTLTLRYDESLNTRTPSTSDFVVYVNGVPVSKSSVSIEGVNVIITLSSDVGVSSVVGLDYTPGINPIKDVAGNNSASLSGRSVNNTTITSCFGVNVGVSNYSLFVGTRLYVSTNSGVKVVDTITDSVISSISTEHAASYSTAVGNSLYVSDGGVNSLSVIDINPLSGTYNTVIDTISIDSPATYSIAIGTNLYVNNNASSTVSVIDTNPSSGTYNTVIDTIPITPGSVDSVLYSSTLVGTKLYAVTNGYGANNVSIIDVDPSSGTYNTVVGTITVGTQSYLATLVGKNLYIPSSQQNNVYVVDVDPSSGTYNTVIDTISIGLDPYYFNTVVDNKIYIVNLNSDNVSVIDADPLSGTYNTVVATIPVGTNPIVSFSSGSKVYVVNNGSDNVSVIDTNTDTVSATLAAGTRPSYASVAGDKVYISNQSNFVNAIGIDTNSLFNTCAPHLTSITSNSDNGTYTEGQSVNITANFDQSLAGGSKMRITLNTGDVVDLTSVSGPTLTGSYVVGPGDSTPDLSVALISSNQTYTNVSDTDLTPNTRTSYRVPTSPDLTGDISRNLGDLKNIVIAGPYCSVSVGTEPYQMVVVGGHVYVANQGSDDVSVINTSNNSVITTINVGSQPYGVTYNGTSKEVYVANLKGNTVSVIDADPLSGTYNTVTHTINVGIEPYYVVSLGTKIYVTNNISNTVSVISTASHTVTATVGVGVAPRGIKAYGTDLYVANFGSHYGSKAQGTVSVINSVNNLVIATIDVGSGPRGVAVNGNEVYVANWNDNTVSVISTASNTVTHTIAVGNGPRGMLSLGSNIYVENYKDGTISVIATGSHSVTATVDVGNTPAGMTAVGTDIYVSRFTDGVVSILDSTNNTMKSSCVSADITPPVISSVVATSTSSTTATITWTTDEAATSTIDFGLTSSYGTASSSSLSTTTHSFTLSSLTASSTYHYKISSWDSSGNLATTTDDTFTTQAVSSTSNNSSNNSSGSSQSSGGGQTTGGGGYVGVTNIIYGNRDNNSQSNQNSNTPNSGILAKLNLPADFIFKKDASVGAKNNDILNLQKFLNTLGYKVSTTGAGSPGKETSTFGPATRNALIRFQKINNIKPAVGYFGPVTRSLINNLLKKI